MLETSSSTKCIASVNLLILFLFAMVTACTTKTVYADERKLAAPERTYHRTIRQTYRNPHAPTLTKPGYFTRPSLKRLQRMRSPQLKACRLSIGRATLLLVVPS